MLYVENSCMDVAVDFGLEYHLLADIFNGEEILMLWRTTPTVMLGRNQLARAEINLRAAKERAVTVVRRMSGGGTIYTDPGVWQVSFILKRPESLDFTPYLKRIAVALRAMGVPAHQHGRNDLLIGDKKVSGMAQYIMGDRMVFHASVLYNADLEALGGLLTVSPEKLATKGIRSVKKRVTNISNYLPGPADSEAFGLMLGALLSGPDAHRYSVTEQDMAAARKIAGERFANDDWTIGRDPRYDLVKKTRFPAGGVELALGVKGGVILSCAISGDFFTSGDLVALENALAGCPMEREALLRALAPHEGLIVGVDASSIADLILSD